MVGDAILDASSLIVNIKSASHGHRAAFDAPPGPIEDSKFHDKEAEAVIQHVEQEKAAENERLAMG